ncbi:secreted protein [Christiangramia forsetii KT0803]|uniref:Secreted protein n=2 Tax=Christiangramia forsetii TaxID=411153 RepID=A0M0F0_CHRFK|nr:secreted protein [Christiangramia forsetii KT0803]
MQIKNQIKALFLLGIFMLMSFHQVIPHAHHEHQEEKKEIAHHHSGEDHHHQDKKEEGKSEGFLSFLFAMHSHTTTSNEIPVLKEHSENFRFQKTETKNKTEQKYYEEDWVLTDQESVNAINYQPPGKYFNPYLSLLSLRGPPQLV